MIFRLAPSCAHYLPIRVFYVDTTDILSEHSYQHGLGWKAGTLQQKGIKMSSSSLATCVVTDAVIRLYYLPDSGGFDPIIEMAWEGTDWFTTTAVIKTRAQRFRRGCPLSAVAWRDNKNHVRLYCAHEFAWPLEIAFEESSGWTESVFSPSICQKEFDLVSPCDL